jgi:hypothetical protein
MNRRALRHRWPMRKGVALTCLLLSWALPVSAEERRLALINPDTELDHAVALALTPWGTKVLTKQDAPPAPSLPTASEQARALALAWGVNAVVWITPAEHGSLLWIYETDTDSVSTRQLAEAPPFSSPDAAAVALTLKSLLRVTEARQPAPAAPPAPPPPPPPPPVDSPADRFTVSAELNMRYLASETYETRGALGGVWWLGAEPTRWGIGVKASAGPGIEIGRGSFSGQLRQLSLSASVTWKVIGNRFLASSLVGGASAHYVELSGFDRQAQRETELRRVAPSIDAGTEIALSLLGPLSLGFGMKAMYFPRYERYLARGTPVLESWPVAAEFGGRLAVDLL